MWWRLGRAEKKAAPKKKANDAIVTTIPMTIGRDKLRPGPSWMTDYSAEKLLEGMAKPAPKAKKPKKAKKPAEE